ncbi:hypothetical protein [Streptomyces sp. RB17]|uniref:hypothetical protein n=1 Tax=Streptomyces sp. RB17 TaxID=2585197 RepID=UPI001295B79A|nr:hypothetical protein [Streptomyces sp. RB17]
MAAGRAHPASPTLLRRLGPWNPWAGNLVPDLVRHAVERSPDGIRALREFVASLPQHKPVVRTEENRETSAPVTPSYAGATGPGALLMLLVHNRNLGLVATAKAFAPAVTSMPPDLAALTGAPVAGTRTTAAGPGELLSEVWWLTDGQLRQVIEIAGAQAS